jgi:hypothetical protein
MSAAKVTLADCTTVKVATFCELLLKTASVPEATVREP